MPAKIWTHGPYAGSRAMKPTLKHRIAMWECMLGTVYASDGRTVKYFDYRWEEAREFAGMDREGADPRVWPNPRPVSVGGQPGPRRGQRTVYIRSDA